jgi:hypothetical protein
VKPWFRFHTGVVDDPKVQMLSPEMFKHWVNVLCIAGKYDGELPAIAVTAFTLHMSEPKAAGILAKLHSLNLLDKTEKSFKPHNWDGRQYKFDKTDNTNADRQRRYRERHRNANSNAESGVTSKRPETENREQKGDDAGDARASLVSREAFELADELLVIAGHSLDFVPPGWCGAGMRVQAWLSEGWHPDVIRASVKAASAKKRGKPAYSVEYFENAIAEAVARQSAPLPKVEIREAEKLTVTKNAKTGGFDAAYDSVLEKLNAGFGRPASEERLRIGEGEADARLLAYRGRQ